MKRASHPFAKESPALREAYGYRRDASATETALISVHRFTGRRRVKKLAPTGGVARLHDSEEDMPRPVFLISACLAGMRTRYDGSSRSHPLLAELAERAVLVPACPEILGGMGIPRPRCRFQGGDGRGVLHGHGRVMDSEGNDRTSAFIRGAQEVRRLVELIRPELVVMKEGSPSCGMRRVDVEGRKERGCGVTTAVLSELGIPVVTEEDSLP